MLQYVDQQGAFSLQSGTITITGKEYEDNGSEIRFSADYDDGNGTLKFTANPNKAIVSDGDYFDSITVEVP